MPSNHLILCRLLVPSIFLSIRVFSNESVLCIRWPKYQSFSFSIGPSNEEGLDFNSGLNFFRIDWFDLLAVQETLKSLLQHHNSKASVLWCSDFFMVQLSHWETQTVFMTQVTWMGLWFALYLSWWRLPFKSLMFFGPLCWRVRGACTCVGITCLYHTHRHTQVL